jgi:hypothetical protein
MLQRCNSLVALLFRLEQPCSLSELQGLVDQIVCWFRRHDGLEALKHLFCELIRQAIHGIGIRVQIPAELMEIQNMLITHGRRWREQWQTEGKAKGEAKGKIKGKAEDLEYVLVSRFGPLSRSVRKRIQVAKLANIERWFKRAIHAQDMASVFEPPR